VQDTGAGTLIGTKTFGKGSVQSILKLGNDTAIKLTIAKYATPNNRFINGIGIVPDMVVEFPENKDSKEVKLGRLTNAVKEGAVSAEELPDPQLDAALKLLKGKL